jgi:predicted nucleic acid-binding protein
LPGEPYEKQAAKVMQDQRSGTFEACAPSFMVHEVANSLWKAIRQKRMTLEDATKALKTLENTEINLYEINWAEVSNELNIASKYEVATYDAAYLSLSKKINAPIITADDKLYQKAKGHFNIIHLKDYT